jgi:serine/threonine protein kinase
MGLAEMQRHLTAYGSGHLPEYELRSLIRSALAQEPQLSPAFMALTDAYRRANLIDAKLQSTINADIAEVTGPNLGLTMVRPPPPNTPWISDGKAANSTDVNVATRGLTGPEVAVAPVTISSMSMPTTGTTSTNGSRWDVEDRLAEVAEPLCPGSVIRDRFVLVEELGRGGMGVVYRAYDRSRGEMKDRYVAIKVLNEEFKRHPLAVRALQRESRKAQKLAHPNIVAVHDFDRDGGNVYMVMELLSGRSLDQVLRDDGQGGIPLGPAMEIIKSLAAALSYAHEQDIVHCDFKPSNAFLGRDGKVKVLDFGIARAAPSMAERADTTMFDAGQLGAVSPAYASLEMLQREQPDVRDDVYAFACVAYELLTGCHPYQRLDALKAYQMELQPRPVRKLSRSQWRALKQGLAFRRVDRSPSIDALARELVVPQSNAKVWIAGAAACVAAVALIGGVAWKWSDIQRTVTQYFRPAHPDVSAAHADLSGSAQSGTPASAQGDTAAGERQVPPSSVPAQRHAPVSALTVESPTAQEPAPPKAATTSSPPLPADAIAPRTSGSGSVAVPSHGQPTQAAGNSTPLSPAASATAGAPVALDRDKSPDTQGQSGEEKRAGIEMLREQFETQAAAGDITGATATSKSLARASPGSPYVAREIPRILALSYVHLAKTQFAGGQVNAALQTLEDGRKKFTKSTDLQDLQMRYVAVANIYDRLSTAVVLNAKDMQGFLEELKTSEGDEYDVAAQMLAQTLADRIADQRAANRDAVADKLLESGKQVFPSYTGILGRGRAGALQSEPAPVTAQ